jgi:excisionase family DNA binding protein
MIQKLQDADEDLVGLSPLLTYPEAGRYIRKGATFVRRAVYAGELAVSRIGKTPYIHRDELDRFIAERSEVGDAARRPGRGRKPAAKRTTAAAPQPAGRRGSGREVMNTPPTQNRSRK